MEQTALDIAANTWGVHPLDWPSPPRFRPMWWEWKRKDRRTLHELESVFGHLDDDALGRWWIERRRGQSVYEDVGGYLLRCYRAMLGEAVTKPYTYDDFAADLIEDAARRTP